MRATEDRTRAVTARDLLARVGAIAPVLEEHARESDEQAHLADASVEALRANDFFRLWCPAELGGCDASLLEGIEVIEALARVETTAAWNLAVGTTSNGFAGAYFSDDAATAIFRTGVPVIAGQVGPIGRATRVDGGLRVSGRWSFGSGIHQATWVLGGAVLRDGDRTEPIVVGAPIDKVAVDEESWQVLGLSGTGSCDYSMDDVFIPDGYWFPFPAPQKRRGGRSFELPIPGQAMVLHAGLAIGAAQRSLDDIAELARSKVRAFTKGSVAQSTSFQRELSESHARVAAARLYVYDVARRIEAAIGSPQLPRLLLEGRMASRYATDVALDVATLAYRRGGGTSLRLHHPLQRTLRDVLAATQHVYVEESAYVLFGADLLGVQP